MQVTPRTAITSGLIALILASAGGVAFLHKNQNPTLREVYAACEKGDLSGVACCEDMRRADMVHGDRLAETCGMIGPGKPDPFGVRKQEEDAFDATDQAQRLSMKDLQAGK
jgi:hypothetical protein